MVKPEILVDTTTENLDLARKEKLVLENRITDKLYAEKLTNIDEAVAQVKNNSVTPVTSVDEPQSMDMNLEGVIKGVDRDNISHRITDTIHGNNLVLKEIEMKMRNLQQNIKDMKQMRSQSDNSTNLNMEKKLEMQRMVLRSNEPQFSLLHIYNKLIENDVKSDYFLVLMFNGGRLENRRIRRLVWSVF